MIAYGKPLCIYGANDKLNETFDLGDEIILEDTFDTDRDIPSETYQLSLTWKLLQSYSRQLDVSIRRYDGNDVWIFMTIFLVSNLLSKVIIEKNAQSISMIQILGYTNGEISRLYILSITCGGVLPAVKPSVEQQI